MDQCGFHPRAESADEQAPADQAKRRWPGLFHDDGNSVAVWVGDLDRRTQTKSQKVAVISETMAQRFFPNSSPLGKRFGTDGPESRDEIEIIGVVKDAKYAQPDRGGASRWRITRTRNALNLSTTLSCASPALPEAVIPQVRQAIKQVNHNLPIDEVVSLSEHIGQIAGPAETDSSARVLFRIARVAACVCRVVRRLVLCRRATHQRDWHSDGPRRAIRQRAVSDLARGNTAGRFWPGRWRASRLRNHALCLDAAVRTIAD